MKVRRYVAKDMREGLRLVKEELGADAVILSNGRTAKGVEIVAALDYDDIAARAAAPEAAAPAKPSVTDNAAWQEALNATRPQEEIPAYREETQIRVKQTDAQETLAKPAQTRRQRVAADYEQATEADDQRLNAMQMELAGLRELLSQQLSDVSWGNYNYRHPVQAKLLRRLSSIGLHSDVCTLLLRKVGEHSQLGAAWRSALAHLTRLFPIHPQADVVREHQAIALVGPTGVGKTTTIAKLAARFVLTHSPDQLALVTTDNCRIGAYEQLHNLGRVLGVNVFRVGEQESLYDLLDDLSDRKLVLIDTAGVSESDRLWQHQMDLLQDCAGRVKNLLLLPCTSQYKVLQQVAKRYRPLAPAGSILTKQDEASSLGEALSVVIKENLPLTYITTGQHIPDDLHIAKAHQLTSDMVAIAEEMITDENHMADLFSQVIYQQQAGTEQSVLSY